MNETRPAITAQVSCAPELADAMLKRVFKAAEILATVKQTCDCDEEIAENHAKNQPRGEMQYREDELTTDSA